MSETDSTKLLIVVSRRLFVAVMGFLALALVLGILLPYFKDKLGFQHGQRIIVPGLVIVSGIIGGFVGLQRRLKELTIPDLELIASSWIYASLSPLVGGVLALLLYVLFLSELITSNLFPHFEPKENAQICIGFQCMFQQDAGYREYAKLIFWCFMAGYFERFVTDVISRFEGVAVKEIPPSVARIEDAQPSAPEGSYERQPAERPQQRAAIEGEAQL
jgi:hypothetical protein